MKPISARDLLSTLRQTITALDSDPEPLTPQLLALRELLESRLRRLETDQYSDTAAILAGLKKRP